MAKLKVRVRDLDAGRVRIEGVEAELRRGPFRQYIDRKGVRVKQAAQSLAPVSKVYPRPPHSTMPPANPGRLKRSIYAKAITVRGLPAVEVGAKVPYIGYVVEGTPPHVIVASRKQTLAFYWPKISGFYNPVAVNHPGTRPNDFLKRALRVAGY